MTGIAEYTFEELCTVLEKGVHIGKGAARRVFDLNGYAVKIPARLKTGLRDSDFQSDLELEVYLNCPDTLKYLLCPVLNHYRVNDVLILVMPVMQTLTKDEARTVKKFPTGKTLLEKYYSLNNLEGYQRVKQDTLSLCSMFDLAKKEFFDHERNWGIDGRAVRYLDYGFKKLDTESEIL